MKVAITGSSGFVGTHLKNLLSTKKDVEVFAIDKTAFSDQAKLDEIICKSDVVVHLAAVNRHDDANQLSDTNIHLVESLIDSCERTSHTPFIIFSSSLQEDQDNPYGYSKKKGQELLAGWSKKHNSQYTGLVIPNVFGPFGKPFYNSVIATFCHQIANGDNPTIIDDKEIKLIYVNDLVSQIWNIICNPQSGKVNIVPKYQIKVSELLQLLNGYKSSYMDRFVIPPLNTDFELALFNTFRTYIPTSMYPMRLKKNEDARGLFVEVVRNHSGGQFSFSTTKPGITRGNHFHTRKFERFAVIQGEAIIRLRRIDQQDVIEYSLHGDQPAFVDMPVWHTHNITNAGKVELITLFWINEPYNESDPDTFYRDV